MSSSITAQYSDAAQETLEYLPTIVRHEGYYEIAQLLMTALSASDVSSLLVALQVQSSTSLCQRYRRFLHPLRDIDPTMRAFDPWIRDKCQILLLGPDCKLLMQRIMDPEAYYTERSCDRDRLEIWVIAIPPKSQTITKRASRLVRVCRRAQNYARRERAFRKLGKIIDQGLILKQYVDDQDIVPCDGPITTCENIRGESVDVKVFDLLMSVSSEYLEKRFVVGLDYAGLEFRLEWDIRENKSTKNWRAADGLPCINAASPYHLETGTAMLSDERLIEGTLAFFSFAPYCRQPILSIPIRQIPRRS
ncbi:hypothetical protein BDV38DRAFT_287996 [Aspergillus pseudotamarii]|uniref:Uncharacterized protein n=1 Tax=Aspergillus pseudotamarii TaxID=132259 RepID=A0A5N6SDY4_ASPPS|nr:uncharacterized protein BDV38DRAFT_287996 [Aspergillus pseudotamarii]KAE8132147.1 hypothetical protein BDV38DRAFT_287996 [Aspergillus pseudotamarii]